MRSDAHVGERHEQRREDPPSADRAWSPGRDPRRRRGTGPPRAPARPPPGRRRRRRGPCARRACGRRRHGRCGGRSGRRRPIRQEDGDVRRRGEGHQSRRGTLPGDLGHRWIEEGGHPSGDHRRSSSTIRVAARWAPTTAARTSGPSGASRAVRQGVEQEVGRDRLRLHHQVPSAERLALASQDGADAIDVVLAELVLGERQFGHLVQILGREEPF